MIRNTEIQKAVGRVLICRQSAEQFYAAVVEAQALRVGSGPGGNEARRGLLSCQWPDRPRLCTRDETVVMPSPSQGDLQPPGTGSLPMWQWSRTVAVVRPPPAKGSSGLRTPLQRGSDAGCLNYYQ